MNTRKPQPLQTTPVLSEATLPSPGDNNKNFNFDAWAVQVKQQMLDALSRRGLK